MITSLASNFPCRNSWRVSNEKALDYAGDFGSHSGSCRFGGAFSSDYMPLYLYNSAFSSFSELSVLLSLSQQEIWLNRDRPSGQAGGREQKAEGQVIGESQ